MRIASVSSVSPTTTGVPADDRVAQDRDRIREQQQQEAARRQVQPAKESGRGAVVDRRV